MAKKKPVKDDQPRLGGMPDPIPQAVRAAAKAFGEKRDEAYDALEEAEKLKEVLKILMRKNDIKRVRIGDRDAVLTHKDESFGIKLERVKEGD